MKNYLIYPAATVRISQSHTEGNHASHGAGSPADFPFDEAGADAGRDWFFCPCDGMKIIRIYGVEKSDINTGWMQSASPVVTPVGTGYIVLMVEHPEDDDLAKLRVGQTFRRGEKMFREGGNGAKGKGTFGNHFHISAAFGNITGNGWAANSRGAWVLTADGRKLKADEAFFIDGQQIFRSAGYHFKNIPKEEVKMDNKPNLYAADAVEWAKKNGIIVGDPKGDLKLHAFVTRQDMLVFLYRFYDLFCK